VKGRTSAALAAALLGSLRAGALEVSPPLLLLVLLPPNVLPGVEVVSFAFEGMEALALGLGVGAEEPRTRPEPWKASSSFDCLPQRLPIVCLVACSLCERVLGGFRGAGWGL